jgi:transposase
MAYFYVGGDREQRFLLPVSMGDWLDEGHLAWFVIDVVAKIDTSAFHAAHRNDGPGRPAYNPDMMLALLLYAYGTGLRSSRRIEAACRTDAAFRVISGSVTPDHATIARFLVDHEEAIKTAFVAVLRVCAKAGLVSVGTIAIDGTKMGADAALDANRQGAWIRAEVERILGEAVATDTAEDAQPGLFGGDELPGELSSRSGRLARLQMALAHIEAEDAAAEADDEERAARALQAAAEGVGPQGPIAKDPRRALARAEAAETAARVQAERRAAKRAKRAKETGRPEPEHLDLDLQAAIAATGAARAAAQGAAPRPTKANITDPDSRIMMTPTGFIQGYNCQAAVNAQQIVVAYAVTQQVNDKRQYQPMVAATRSCLDAAGITTPIGLVLADAGYWSHGNAIAEGPDKLIATQKDWKQRRAARDLGTTTGPPPAGASPMEAMEHRLRTPEGAADYAKRGHTVEPVFGHGKENRGYRRFRRRGLAAVTSEWALITISHNLGKLFAHQARPAAALAAT